MATFGRSLKPSSFLMSSGKRPGMSARSMSNSSMSSISSNDDGHHMHFVLSGANTPISENVPAGCPEPRSPTAFPGFDRGPTSSPLGSPRSVASQPIAIELPSIRRFGASPVYTPPEPLSARGDLQGGYFPNHEDPKKRVRKPHPFQPDARKGTGRHQSALPVLDGRPSGPTQPKMASAAFATSFMSDSAQYHPLRSAVDAAVSQPMPHTTNHTPVASYMPSGEGDYLPMGKYYPSNYESRNPPRSNPPTRAPTNVGPASLHLNNMKSDSHVPTVGLQNTGSKSSISQHARSASEAKRRLQQYQRDMVTQATQAANKVLGSHGSPQSQAAPVSKSPTAMDKPASFSSASTIRNLHLPGSSKLAVVKPTSPRLQPLGSPGGLVTPMDLGTGTDDGFFSPSRLMSGPDAEREQAEVRMALRADDERRRQGGSESSALDIGRVAAT